ncbi:MAG: hypothetical protein NTW87_15335 [Planctomycetota bacterium]|nr:hypothetical protein [Planctomycetota bacterium]
MTARLSFGPADHGVAWAASRLPQAVIADDGIRSGATAVQLARFAGAAGPDDYAVRFRGKDRAEVAGNSAVGMISGLLRLRDILCGGRRKDFTANLRLRTRNYKHELQLDPSSPRWVGNYTDEIWETLCRQIAGHQFNGLVFYAGYHFFEYVLDYAEYPDAASHDATTRAAVRAAVQRGLAIAHRYGLKTFFQHYVGHFTPQLARKYRIPTTGRFSTVEHPEVERYCRYCYREVFRQLPDLDGLYFNFESYSNAHEHVLRTAILEFNRMARKPIVVFRLWGYTSFEGMQRMMRAYKGRIILSHKVMDTNDAYYLPVADSRVREWKQALGQQIEFMYCVGPCHNCGTNLCDQLWSDYDFIQNLLADAQAKGADSISFHSYRELFSADLPDPHGVFPVHEKAMSRHNFLHLQAVVDYANRVKRPPAGQAAILAARCDVPPAAGRALHKAIRASSQIVLLTYQQFWLTSAYDGFLNRGRYSCIQEPFYYYPVTELNHQARRPMWNVGYEGAWVTKTIDAIVTPDRQYQCILDCVDPTKRKARLNPGVIVRLMQKCIRESEEALRAYGRTAGSDAATKLAPYIQQNALLGRYVGGEVKAAMALYSLYFARTRAGLLAAATKGLAELEAVARLVLNRTSTAFKVVRRVTMLNLNPDIEIGLARELLQHLKEKSFPPAAFAAYAASRRHFNEIRRVIRPFRLHDQTSLGHARRCLQKALAGADAALAGLQAPQHEKFAANVRRWRDYLLYEQQGMTPPRITCDDSSGPLLQLRHDDCFRAGEDFLEDFLGFFRPLDYKREEKLFVRVFRTRDALAVTLREECTDVAARRALWAKWKGSGSDSFVMRVSVDVENKGREGTTFIVWPEGSSVSMDARAHLPVRTAFNAARDHWETTVWLPFKLLGRTPRKGDVWGLNLNASPYVNGNRAYTWAPQYDCNNPKLYGKITFAGPRRP